MKDNITLGEVKAQCVKMTKEYGQDSCNHCPFEDMGCCCAPDEWNLEATDTLVSQPDWESMYHEAMCRNKDMCSKMEEMRAKACFLDEENRKLRTIVSTMETMLGRKFEV